MRIDQYLDHHGITENPFSQEDAQTDHVFREHCLEGTRHPTWDKIYSSPEHPSTSVVFGEKGSGKTAIRLQIAAELNRYNREHSEKRAFVIEYDDFNPFLDCFRERLHGRKRRPERVLEHWRLWDHMDAILSLGVKRLGEAIILVDQGNDGQSFSITKEQLDRLTRLQKRDLLLLASFYDHALDLPPIQRWNRLRRKLKFGTWRSEWDRALGLLVTGVVLYLAIAFPEFRESLGWWGLVFPVVGWFPWLLHQSKLLWLSWKVSRQIRAIEHQPNTLRKVLSRFLRREISGQPIPSKDRSDDRYELLLKFQDILRSLGFQSIIVLVDRVDEPHLINGSAERMRDLLWPMFDNKFLKHPGVAFKLLLPAEVTPYLIREEKEFYDRSRLDKQNLIMSLNWTGESLYDVVNDRMAACKKNDVEKVSIRQFFDESITEQELIGIFTRLRVPRHLFKFIYRLMVDHCGSFTEENPNWKISRETLQATLALYLRDLDAFDHGQGTG